MIDSDRLEAALDELATSGPPPPMDEKLSQQIEAIEPVKTRVPRRHLVLLYVVSLAYAGGLLGFWWFRPDLRLLPRVWLVLYCVAWFTAFATIMALIVLTKRGRVMPNWRVAAGLGVLACVGFTVAGLLLARQVPGVSQVYPETARDLAVHGHWCLRWGLITAIAPIALAALLLRGAVPVGARAAGLAIGAGGGALGGLFLHLHCPIADRLHLGLIHGGVVLLAAGLAALIIPRFLRA